MEKLLVEPEKKWFDHKFIDEPTEYEPIKDLAKINGFRESAKKLYEQDIFYYKQYREKNKKSDDTWIRTVLQSGTINDKITANCIQVQDSAVHNLGFVDNLIASVKLNKKRECMLSIDALKNLFISILLPKRPLRSFHQHPFDYLDKLQNDTKLKDKRLLIWYFESLLKAKFNNFIKSLQLVFQDTLATTKYKVASCLFDLISNDQCEQQKIILELIINKLGDPDYQVASKIVYLTKNYLYKSPKSKLEVILEIERLVSRQNISPRAQYYGFCCLSQIILTRQDSEVANRLMLIYFSFFKKFVKSDETDSRMLGVLLTGVNRAYKFAKMNSEDIDANLNTLFKLVHITSFNVSLQALMLLNQVVDSREDILHRYFNALYRKMLALEWRNTAKETFFLNLLYNSVKRDDAIPRIKAFVKRLLQICFAQHVPFVCGSFILVSELLKTKRHIFQVDHSVLTTSENGTAIADGKKKLSKFAEDDEEERFVDVKTQSDDEDVEDSGDEADNGKEAVKKNGKDKAKSTSWMHKKNVIFKRHERYDINERNPLYCGADKTLTYELLPFTKHYHPTVVVFANQLLNNEPVEYTGDPMEDFTLVHFLDRFVFKNPKKVKKDTNTKKSIFEPVKSIHKSKVKHLPINSKEYLNLDQSRIPEEEKIFYNYYKSQMEKKGIKEDLDSEADSISDTEFDDFLFKNEVDGADAVDDEIDLELDYADGVSKDTKKKKKKSDEDSEDDDDDSLEDSEEDEDFKNAMDAEMGSDFDDLEGDSEPELNEDDEEDAMAFAERPKKRKRGKEDLSDMFAAAEEFSHIIDDSSKYDALGVGAVSNKDKASAKQLQWEMKNNDESFKKRRGGSGGAFNKKSGKGNKSSPKKGGVGKLANGKKKLGNKR